MCDDLACNATPATEPAVPSPGIKVKSLAKGTTLFLEGETDLYELTMTYPEHGIAEIASNNPTLRQPTVGQFMCSVHWGHPGVRSNVIHQGWAIVLRFRNGQFQTQPIASARVRGNRSDGAPWYYDVF